jgi:RNA polymerase sigma-70 factor (ECF subfamily)
MRIVRHAAIDTVRREAAAKRPRLGEQKGETADPQSDSLADDVAAADQAEALRASLAQLPASQAEVIGLAFFGELSHSEIAHELELPSGTVKGRMRLGLEKLRRQMRTAA